MITNQITGGFFMMTLFEQQGGTYQTQGDYFIPYVVIKDQKEVHIGVWANRHRQYLKQFHRVRYYNLLTSEKLYEYLSDIEEQAEKMFEELVKSLAEKENVTEKLKVDNPMLWVQKMNNIRNRATEIVNSVNNIQMKIRHSLQREKTPLVVSDFFKAIK